MTDSKKVEIANFDDLNEEKIMLEWEAPERSFKRRDRDFWVTAISILVLVGVILIFIKEFFLIVALGSALFLYYVMSTVPPEKVHIKITNRAVYFGDASYPWAVIDKFWFGNNESQPTVCFGTILKFPQSISFLYDRKNKDKIKEVIIKKVPLVQNSPTMIDKITGFVAKRLPLEDREEGKK